MRLPAWVKTNWIRRFAVAHAALLAVILADCGPSVALARPARPNILLILADDVGREAIGCYGGQSPATPHIDQLARTGLRFRHCYSMPVCHPTRVCLLAGRYPFRLGHPPWGTFPAVAEGQTLAQVLRGAGYATAIAGKWQLALLQNDPGHPARLGFQESCLFGWHEGPRYYRPRIWQNGALRDDVDDRYGPDVYTDFLIDFIARNRQQPFFAYYSLALCHSVTDDLDAPVPFGPRGRYDSFHEMVEAMDVRVGRLVAALDRLGLRQRTLILFTADNGAPKESIITARDGTLVREKVFCRTAAGLVPGGKGELTDAGTRVPTIASWPGTVAAGEVTDALVDFSDFLPTLADLAGAALPAGVALDGQSFAPQLRGGAGGRRWVFAEHKGRSWVRTRRWKLYDDGRLLDVGADPQETAPVPPAGQSDEVAAVRAMLQRVRQQLAAAPAGAAGGTIDDGVAASSQ